MYRETKPWVRVCWVKATRYYEVHLHPDLWGQWIVTRIWGRSGTALGRRVNVPCLSYQDGLQQVAAVRDRRRQRGYRLVREEADIDCKDLPLR